MKHELRQQRIILCDPEVWAERIAVVDEYQLPMADGGLRIKTDETPLNLALPTQPGRVIHKAGWNDENDDDEDTDIWGDPLPAMKMTDAGVAIIPLKGMIYGGLPSMFKRFGYIDLDDVAANVETAMADNNCKGIVLAVDSPGGTLRSLPEFASLVSAHAAAGTKKIAARVDGYGCSAAYYAIAGCNVISAAPSAQLPNIGVYQAMCDSSKAFEAFGYRMEIIKSGKYKAAGYPGTSLTDDQRAEIKGKVEELGAAFRAHVSAGRPSADSANMEGQTFSGTKAMNLGFADDDAPTFAAFLNRFTTLLT